MCLAVYFFAHKSEYSLLESKWPRTVHSYHDGSISIPISLFTSILSTTLSIKVRKCGRPNSPSWITLWDKWHRIHTLATSPDGHILDQLYQPPTILKHSQAVVVKVCFLGTIESATALKKMAKINSKEKTVSYQLLDSDQFYIHSYQVRNTINFYWIHISICICWLYAYISNCIS